MIIVGKIASKLNDVLVVKCESGFHHKVNTWGTSSGCFACEHNNSTTYFDYVNLSEMSVITDPEIIKEINK